MVRRYHKHLDRPPTFEPLPGITIRQFVESAEDIGQWLAIHTDAYGQLVTGARPWTARDFSREFLSKPNWRPGDMWFAQVFPDGEAIGTITCSRLVDEDGGSVIRWLGVCREWQRRGVGRALVSVAEQYSWKQERPYLRLETLNTWTVAVALYESVGYSLVPGSM